VYLLDNGALKDMKFPAYVFDNTSQGKFMLQIIFSYSKYYVDSLSENVRRGIRRKLDLGILPNRAPLGYWNDKVRKTIVVDRRSFPVVRKIWDLTLTGSYSPRQIRNLSEQEWGYRTPRRERSGGTSLALSTIYKILSNPFYTGVIVRQGIAYKGAHPPMVTQDEFDRAQEILGRPGRPKTQKHTFAYTGMIRCGGCGCSITAEIKVNHQGYRYTYYHCTKKRKDAPCFQPSIELKQLERQLLRLLHRIAIAGSIHDWMTRYVVSGQHERTLEDERELAALQRTISDAERSLSSLTDLRVRELIDDTDFIARRQKLHAEVARTRETIARRIANPDYWFEPARLLISFSKLAVSWFERGNVEVKRLILNVVGSNLLLLDKKVSIQAAEPFRLMPKNTDFLRLCAFVENVRTLADDPDFKRRIACIARLEEMMRVSDGRP